MKRCPIHDPPEKRDEADDIFMDVTEEEIISLWHSLQTRVCLNENEAWNAIVAGIVLNEAFRRARNTANTTH